MEMHKNGQPAISIDAKKKENIGEFKNNGEELCEKGKPILVNSHDFPDYLRYKIQEETLHQRQLYKSYRKKKLLMLTFPHTLIGIASIVLFTEFFTSPGKNTKKFIISQPLGKND